MECKDRDDGHFAGDARLALIPRTPLARPSRAGREAANTLRAKQWGTTMAEADPQKIFPVSWDQFHRDARALAWRLAGSGPFQGIVCITRGGLVPAAIVARDTALAERLGKAHAEQIVLQIQKLMIGEERLDIPL